jgi:hypothetical protein
MDVFAGFGDGLTFGLTAYLRENLFNHWSGNIVDQDSSYYGGGELAGDLTFAVGVAPTLRACRGS